MTPSAGEVRDVVVPLRILREPLFFDCVPRWSWHAGALPHWMVWAVLRGQGRMTLGRATYPLRPGSVFLLRPGANPEADHDPSHPLLVYTVHFVPEGSVPQWKWDDLPQHHLLLDVGGFGANARVSVSAWGRGDPCGRARARLAIWQLLMQMADEQQRKGVLEQDDKVSRLLARIDESPHLRWSVEEMAAAVGFSGSTLHRVFRKMTGYSPGDYLVQRRIQMARQLLETSNLAVREIADTLGYADAAFFSRQFTKVEGCSPLRFRRSARDES